MKRIVAAIWMACALWSCGGDKEAMRQRLAYVSQCNREDTLFTEAWLPTVDSLASYFDRHGNANERMTAHYLQGRVHHDMGEAPIALECYQKATEVADTTRKDCDLHTLAAIYGQMADLFDLQFLPEDGMNAQLKAEHFFLKDNDTLSAIKAYELRIKPYFLMGEIDSMILIMNNARDNFLHFGDTAKAAVAIYPMISISLDRNQLDEAKHYLDIYENESNNFDENGNLIFGGHYYCDKGRYLLCEGKVDSARNYFFKAIERGVYEGGYKGLLSVYKEKQIPDSIVKYAELFAKANDSSYLHVNQERVHQVSAMYNYSRNEKVARQKEKQASDLWHFIIFMVLSVMAILFFLAYLFYRYREKLFTQLNRLKDRKDALEEIVREKEREIKLVLEHRKSYIDKNILEKQTTIDSVNKELEKLKQQIATLQSKAERFQHDKLEDDFYSIGFIEEFEARFKEYGKDYKPPTTREWLRLEKVFSIHFPTYYQKITCKDEITKEHVRICMLIRMDFKERMMAIALKTDGKRIDRSKRQANRILFGEDNASTLKSNLKRFFQ
ncbi:MAG: hypothetical protein IJK42_10080 [Prevotella sp.]|nr:hypothetical protein [Prevotella sp.]